MNKSVLLRIWKEKKSISWKKKREKKRKTNKTAVKFEYFISWKIITLNKIIFKITFIWMCIYKNKLVKSPPRMEDLGTSVILLRYSEFLVRCVFGRIFFSDEIQFSECTIYIAKFQLCEKHSWETIFDETLLTQ